MGFGTILGMHNLRAFLFKFKENLPQKSGVKIESHESRSNSKLKSQGFNPGLTYLKITKDEKVIFEIDAADDEGYSAEGDADLKKAVDSENMDQALDLYSRLVE